jgi:hypothetical protein
MKKIPAFQDKTSVFIVPGRAFCLMTKLIWLEQNYFGHWCCSAVIDYANCSRHAADLAIGQKN